MPATLASDMMYGALGLRGLVGRLRLGFLLLSPLLLLLANRTRQDRLHLLVLDRVLTAHGTKECHQSIERVKGFALNSKQKPYNGTEWHPAPRRKPCAWGFCSDETGNNTFAREDLPMAATLGPCFHANTEVSTRQSSGVTI